MKVKREPSSQVRFVGGPFNNLPGKLSGEALQATCVFTASGQTGYYKCEGLFGRCTRMEWVPV